MALLQHTCDIPADRPAIEPVVEVLGVQVTALPEPAALDAVETLCNSTGSATLMFVNAHSLNTAARDSDYQAALHAADVVFNDGAGLALAARLQGKRFPANLNGTDLTPLILRRAAAQGRTVFLLGGRPGVAEAAASRLVSDIRGLIVVGTADGYLLSDAEAVDKIRASGADILLVAMGNPRQELWLHRHAAETGVSLGIAVGAFFDFCAGEVRRAPALMRRMRLEWMFRLALEPRRLFRRYIVGNPEFVVRILIERARRPIGRATGWR